MKFVIPFLAVCIALAPIKLSAHCQLPCGIYHDDLKFAQLDECIQTIKKAIDEIKANGGGSALENNQLVRSVNLKDEYADKIAHMMSFYFLQQRMSSSEKNFAPMLCKAFEILKMSAQVKSSVDVTLVNELQSSIASFKKLYKHID